MSSSQKTRQDLLQAAWELMREDASSASLARIATKAGVSRQALYLHFDGRAGLLLAMVRWIDEREHFFEKLVPLSACDDPISQLAGYVRAWLNYLPLLHPVPGFLARAKNDPAARSAWEDRMTALEQLYAVPLRKIRRSGTLRTGLTVSSAARLVRTIASVHAWEDLAIDQGWSQARTVDALWNGVSGAILSPD